MRSNNVTLRKPESKKTGRNSKIAKKKTTVRKKRLMTQIQPRKKIISGTSSRPDDETTTNGVSASAMDQALEVQANLPPPSFVKLMKPSHVTRVFWLGLDKQFCLSHLPKRDDTVFLVDENDVEHETKLLCRKNGFGLSGGWGRFAKAKHLREEDVLIFQHVGPCKLKVHIFRAKTVTGLDGKGNPQNLNSDVELMDTDQPKKMEEPLMLDNCGLEQTLMLIDNYDPATDPFDTEIDMDGLEVLERIGFSPCDANFRDIKKFDDFIIEVDDVNLDSKIPMHVRRKYHDLCSSQKILLHENFIKKLNCKLVTGVIFETVNIADAIKGAKSAKKFVSSLESWDKTLESFEGLGMRVGFLRNRVSKLLDGYRKSQAKIEQMRSEKDGAENELKSLDAKHPSDSEKAGLGNVRSHSG